MCPLCFFFNWSDSKAVIYIIIIILRRVTNTDPESGPNGSVFFSFIAATRSGADSNFEKARYFINKCLHFSTFFLMSRTPAFLNCFKLLEWYTEIKNQFSNIPFLKFSLLSPGIQIRLDLLNICPGSYRIKTDPQCYQVLNTVENNR